MPPKLPLRRGWKRRVHSSVLHFPALDLLDWTIHMPFFKRPDSLDHFTDGLRKLPRWRALDRRWHGP